MRCLAGGGLIRWQRLRCCPSLQRRVSKLCAAKAVAAIRIRDSGSRFMIYKILELALRQRSFVLLAAAGLVIAGVVAALRLPIDAVPDITNVQVQINTEVAALAPEEI